MLKRPIFASCREGNPEETAIVYAFLAAMNENNPALMFFVRARGVGDHVEEDASAPLDAS